MGERVLNSLTSVVAGAATNVNYESLPPEVVSLAKQCVLDWIGVALAGSSEPVVQILREELEDEGVRGRCTLFGEGPSVAPRDAALINGTAGHALDFDDVVSAMSGHPSAPLLPALIALGEQIEASGEDLIESFVAGFETECRIGLTVRPGHYRAGWHATGTIGTFGAAAGCARLLGLDSPQTEMALGIAAAQASGLKSLFGTMCKPFQAGKAASCGLLAAKLAQRGFTSIRDVLEAPQGFAATQTDTFVPEAVLGSHGGQYGLESVLFKYHAACFLTHASIEGILRLKEENGFMTKDVRRVTLRVSEGHLSVCNIVNPLTPLEGKFSLRFTAALALATGDVSEVAFTEAAVKDPDINALRGLVDVEPVPGMANHTSETVVELYDGAVLRRLVDMGVSAVTPVDIENQGSRLRAKFDALATPTIGSSACKELQAAIDNLEAVSTISDLTRLCRREGIAS
jgi:2-methylcitrate dehydratase PrpD